MESPFSMIFSSKIEVEEWLSLRFVVQDATSEFNWDKGFEEPERSEDT